MKIRVDGEEVAVEIAVERKANSIEVLFTHPETSDTITVEIGDLELQRIAGIFKAAT